VDVKGEILELKNTINTMGGAVKKFCFGSYPCCKRGRSEGKLGGQAASKRCRRVWKDLTDSVNGMASNLTAQVRNIAE
jgi:hypothetical protein